MIWVLIIHTNSKGSEWFQDNVAARGVLKDTGQNRRGGGGYSHFVFIRRFTPKNQQFQKIYLEFWQPQKISPILYLDL